MENIEKYKSICKSYLTDEVTKRPYTLNIFQKVSKDHDYVINICITLFALDTVLDNTVGAVSIKIVFNPSLTFKEDLFIYYLNDRCLFHNGREFQESLSKSILGKILLSIPFANDCKKYDNSWRLIDSFKEIIDNNYRTLFLEGLFGTSPEHTLTSNVDD
jgi:hypothetical protein